METRRPPSTSQRLKITPLPVDFIKLVSEVFNANFDEDLKKLAAFSPDYGFEISGGITGDEILLSLSIRSERLFQATTIHASVDFDPKANVPSSPELLNACVDAIGAILATLFDPDHPEYLKQIAANSLASLDVIPWEWTALEIPLATGSAMVFLKVDKSRPVLDQLADEWLAKNDPDYQARLDREAKETEKLFVTGAPKSGIDEDEESEEDGDDGEGKTVH